MPSTLGAYNPIVYANEFLAALENELVLAKTVNRTIEEARTNQIGEVITIRKPSDLTVADAGSAAQTLSTGSQTVTLTKHREVKFEISDKEYALTGPRLYEEHIRPAAVKLAEDIDSSLTALIKKIPYAHVEPSAATAITTAGINAARRKLRNNKAPLGDINNMFFFLGGQEEEAAMNLSAFTQHQGAGEAGVQAQTTATIGRKYGMSWAVGHTRPTNTYANISDFAGAVNNGAGYAKGDSSIVVDGLGTAEVYNVGTILKFTSGGQSGQSYVLTATATMSSGGGTLAIYPPLRGAIADNDTFAIGDTAALSQGGAGTGLQDNATNNLNLLYHRNFATLVMAPLPEYGQWGGLGVNVATVRDPKTNLSIRNRIFLDPNSSKMISCVDAFWGVEILYPELACRYEVVAS